MTTKKIRVFETFSGIGSQNMALRNIGLDYEIIATSEIDPLAIKAYSNIHCKDYKTNNQTIPIVEMKNYLVDINIFSQDKIDKISNDEIVKIYNACIASKNLGDISKIDINKIPEHDLLTYSFPCQDISSIGKLKGFDENSGTRSSLLWDCGKIIKEKRPKFLLMENVKNIVTKNNLDNFKKWCNYLENLGYKNFWKLLDSQNFGVSQRRIRCFMVSILNCDFDYHIPERNDKNCSLYDVYDNTVAIDKPCNYSELLSQINEDEIKYLDDRDWKMNGILVGNVSSTQRAGRCGIKFVTRKNNKLFMRNITPLESWRLMGYSDSDYYKMQANNEFTSGNVYHFCGNAIVVNVLEEIFKSMFLQGKHKVINGLSLFSNVGIAETYLSDIGINIKVANELVEERANFYKHLYPDCNMICGDIYEKFDEILKSARENDCQFLIATPPCQGMSVAGKRDYSDTRNLLIFQVFKMIDELSPQYVLIENVPQLLNYKMEYDGKIITINEFINLKYSHIYNINKNKTVLAEDYSVPQHRKRAIILMSKNSKWEYPTKDKKRVTVREAIGDFPSLDPYLRETELMVKFPNFENKLIEAKKFNKWHFPPTHTWRHVEIMMHTPTGHSAFENKIYYPKKANGEKVSGYDTTYKRMKWDEPAPTITMANGSISSQCNVHPGRCLPDGTYSDARVLTICELLKLFTLPLDWDIPKWANENLIRKVIGEGVPPLLIKKIVENRG